MCGIFGYLGTRPCTGSETARLLEHAAKCRHRGPDQSRSGLYCEGRAFLVFHRLKVVDTSDKGMQPFRHREWASVCNGEIYNHARLRKEHGLEVASECDAEVVAPLVRKVGGAAACRLLDGVFAFLAVSAAGQAWVGRDPIGVRPLFLGRGDRGDLVVASEAKSIPPGFRVEPFPPGCVSCFQWSPEAQAWRENRARYCENKFPYVLEPPAAAEHKIRALLGAAVAKRTMSDRPIGCLLSGGLDSSIIAAILSAQAPKGQRLRTFSIGLAGAVDLEYARLVAAHLGTDHTEVVVSEAELLAAIPRAIYHAESYDVTTVRAAAPMLLLSEHIARETDVAVVFSGEGSDEASGSYIYFHNAPDPAAFRAETERLLGELHYFDVLRCDRATAAAGLEVRVPFLDRAFLDYYMSLGPEMKQPVAGVEKHLLRKTFAGLLPAEVAWRKKEGMSDGVSSMGRPWYGVIQEQARGLYSEAALRQWPAGANAPQTLEAHHFRVLFEGFFPGRGGLVPHYWLPKWSGDVKDPSARVLAAYAR
uniref:asparagine synthase (glutamine-hydrolyzing) n=1 Tax=Marseillevirus LCMAC103 TaxID=2506604 RepID=A0A481YVI6_9VIRU|nr:MAG: asparagine synthase [Marseillevirus LCMAC103]